MKSYEVYDGERVFTFEGEVLAETTSWRPDKKRWIDLDLYRTRAGTYVLVGCGRTEVRGEVDRHWVQIADEPEGVIDRLTLYNELGARYIPKTSLRLLERASRNDEGILRAYSVQRVA